MEILPKLDENFEPLPPNESSDSLSNKRQPFDLLTCLIRQVDTGYEVVFEIKKAKPKPQIFAICNKFSCDYMQKDDLIFARFSDLNNALISIRQYMG